MNKIKILLVAVGLLLFFLFPGLVSNALAYWASEETLQSRVKVRQEIKSKYPELSRYTQAERLRRQQDEIARMNTGAAVPAASVKILSGPDTKAGLQETKRFVWQTLIPLAAIAGLLGVAYRAAKKERAR